MSNSFPRLARGARIFLAMAAGLIAAGCAGLHGKPANGQFLERTVRVDGIERRYQVFVPGAAHRHGALPVILFLHGTGERGSDGEAPTRVGLGPYLRTQAGNFPALVVFPQAPEGSDWKDHAARTALAALDAASTEFGGDRQRTYLTGLSMGGYGTWELALMQPQRFAALVPVCGGLTAPRSERDLYVTPLRDEPDPAAALALRLKHVPVWLFHGGQDDVVPPDEDRRIHAALQAANGTVRYTEFAGLGHNSWDAAYGQTPALWPWLFAQTRE